MPTHLRMRHTPLAILQTLLIASPTLASQTGDINGTVNTANHLTSNSGPVLTRMTPGTAVAGETVTLYGANFGPNPFSESQTTVITYEYDDLYRLTAATYTGDIAAYYQYTYDAVGNMTAYMETVEGQIKNVTRAFDAANQLESANGDTPAIVFIYDGNGNLVTTSGANGWFEYNYNQRNLLTSQREMGFEESFLVAEYVYDGNSNRIRQVDHTGTQPIITTYANDPVGLTQVLLADDGTTQTAQLYGLDLIGQDDGTGMRTLLADGLGSVRQEMAGGTVETTTTYAPYGKLLAQTGASGTVYGYTGEQEDAATGLVYLRARYYNPYIYHFQSRDPYPGIATIPASQNGYSYVHGNPVNYTDPHGLCIVGYDGTVRPNQHPYGTSGICPNTEHWIIEGNAAIADYHANFPTSPNQINAPPPIEIVIVNESKPEFPITVPWTQEQGNTASYWTDVVGTGVSGGKTLLSAGGTLGYILGPEWVLGDIFADEAEDFYDLPSIALDIVGEMATGHTRTAFEKNNLPPGRNYRCTLILGPETTRSVLFKIGDMMTPSSVYDLGTNAYDTGYSGAKLLNWVDNNNWELQISTIEPGIKIVIYDPSDIE